MTPLSIGDPEIAWPARSVLGEGPVWAAAEQALYWVDIKGQLLHRYTAGSGGRESWKSDEPVGCIDVPDSEGGIFAATRSGFAWLFLDDEGSIERREILSPEKTEFPRNRFNDGKRAPDGSFWAGSMDDAEKADSGAWWRFDPVTGTANCLERGYRVTNGPAFDSARARVYLTDSARQSVFVADWVPGGGFNNKRLFVQFGEDDGYPDGMQVHPDGSLWIAFWDGACLRRYSPHGDLIQSIALPVRRPTSLAFAPELSRVFVTSASIGLDGPHDGALFSLKVG
jgi:sugar lactone lactonase YvrE